MLKKDQRKIIGQVVLQHRKKAGFSQEVLAEKADIHPNYIGRIERGECTPTITILMKIAKALNLRVYKLLMKL